MAITASARKGKSSAARKQQLTVDPHRFSNAKLQFKIVAVAVGVPADRSPVASRKERLSVDLECGIQGPGQQRPSPARQFEPNFRRMVVNREPVGLPSRPGLQYGFPGFFRMTRSQTGETGGAAAFWPLACLRSPYSIHLRPRPIVQHNAVTSAAGLNFRG